MSLRITAPVTASAVLLVALALTGCSGGSSAPASTTAAVPPASAPASTPEATTPESTPSPSASTGGGSASALNGCPAQLKSALSSVNSSAATFAITSSSALKFPGTVADLDSGCFISATITASSTKVKEVLAFVSGGTTALKQAQSDLKSAGYKETGSTSGTYVKGTDAWIVSASDDSSSPFGSAFASQFPSDTVLIVHASVG